MPVTEIPIDYIIYGVIAVFAVFLTARTLRGSSKISQRLLEAVASFGWENPRRRWWNGSVRGRWRGYLVELNHMNRYKSLPERLLLRVRGQAPQGRVIVKRRIKGFLAKPITIFGPPLVDPLSFADREKYWIRADQMMQAEGIFLRREVTDALDGNLIAGFDLVRVDPKGIQILRALDDSVVKQHYNRPAIQWRRDPNFVEQIAREEWPLAAAIVDAVGVRPSQ